MPQRQMGKNIQAAHSLEAGMLYQMPGAFKNLYAGVEFGIGMYARKSVDQTFMFDGVPSTVPVNYSSNLFNANLQARFNIWDQYKAPIVPYIQAKAGLYHFYSNIVVEDPNDPNGCVALERENIIKDNTLFWSAGGGIQIDPDIFLKVKRKGKMRIDISAQTIRGGTIDYINTKHLMDAQDVPDPGGKSVKARFINASTQSIHEHSVAQLYSPPLSFFELRFGVTVDL
jgi:hypothetical protein